MRRMDLEEKRRNEAEKAAETAKLVAEAAAKAKTGDPFRDLVPQQRRTGS